MEITLTELKSLLDCGPSVDALAVFAGRAVFVRTVTHHHTGRLVAFDGQWLVLEDAAWVADDGRFGAALASGTLNEVEPFPDGRVLVARGCVVDVCEWSHALPRQAK